MFLRFGLLRCFLACALLAVVDLVRAADVLGSGATFPYPIYKRWIADYRAASGANVEYRATGSGSGIVDIEQKRVDFGATDMPLTTTELNLHQLRQFPLVIGGVVPVINIAGIAPGALRLTGAVLADIYLGRIRRWNERAIAALNPGIALPDAYITVVHRDDASGSTYLWTLFLSRSATDWKDRVGSGIRVTWPAGVGGDGNEGVASLVQRTRMSIGYVEAAYALEHRLSHAALRNVAGQFVQPTVESFSAAAEAVEWEAIDGFARVPVDRPEPGAWPVTGASFILVPADADGSPGTAAAMSFFDWVLANGASSAVRLGYAPLPDGLATQVRASWRWPSTP